MEKTTLVVCGKAWLLMADYTPYEWQNKVVVHTRKDLSAYFQAVVCLMKLEKCALQPTSVWVLWHEGEDLLLGLIQLHSTSAHVIVMHVFSSFVQASAARLTPQTSKYPSIQYEAMADSFFSLA